MKRAEVAALLAALGWLLLARPAAAELSASEIVARNVEARGGLQAWSKVRSMVWLGHIESERAPVPSVQFKLEQERPNRTRLQIHALGDKSVRVFDGVHGWKLRPSRGRGDAQPYTPEELRFAQSGHGIDGPLVAAAARGLLVALAGVEQVAGHSAYHLTVTLPDRAVEDVWVDTRTFLELREDRMASGPTGPRRVSVSYADYREVEGLQLPFVLQTGGGPGAASDRMQLETVALNVPLPESTFANPGAPRGPARARGPRGAR